MFYAAIIVPLRAAANPLPLPNHNVFFPFVLPPATLLPSAALGIADRLIATLMTLIEAVSPAAITGSTPTFPAHAAQTLFFRLVRLVTSLIRVCALGIPPDRPAATPKAGTCPAAQRSSPAETLPRRPGWLLAALPDIAPAIAADLAALLADPALTPIFAAAPTLSRPLQPLLRSLGLTRQLPPPSPQPPPAHPAPAIPTLHQPGPAGRPICPFKPTLSHLNALPRPFSYDIKTIEAWEMSPLMDAIFSARRT